MAAASTVTLTGTCYSTIINKTNNYITFNITNSGNGTATNFLIVPEIDGASTPNTTISIPLVAPGGAYSERIYLSNFTIPGSYVERFVARYSQGSSTFTTLFPCLVQIGQNAHSILYITNITRGKRGDNISVNISNIADYPIAAQVSVYAPPDFTVVNPTKNVTMQYGLTSTPFAISTQTQYTNFEFPITVAASYVSGNVHYATERTISIGASAGTSSAFTANLLLFGIVVLVVVIVALIVLSVILKKGKGGAEHHHETEEHHHAEPHVEQEK
jgi:hypothetical protein